MNQQERDKYLEIQWTGPGWKNLIKELDSKMSAIDPDYTIEQIKEKFGGLRYYFSSNSHNADAMYDLLRFVNTVVQKKMLLLMAVGLRPFAKIAGALSNHD